MDFSLTLVLQLLASLLGLYRSLLFVRLILTWFPNISWHRTPFSQLAAITDPLLEPFRRMIPPLGGFDLSPIVVFFLVGLVENALRTASHQLGH